MFTDSVGLLAGRSMERKWQPQGQSVCYAGGVQQAADNLWVMRYPLSLLGMPMGRTVTIIRLHSGQLVIHSTAPFAPADVSAIRALGRPAWLLDATLAHDTFVQAGRAAFPEAAYFAPEGFMAAGGKTCSLREPPVEWSGELDVVPLEGMPRVREHVFLHRTTRTLIVADLVFNFSASSSRWMRGFFRAVGGIVAYPAMSRMFKLLVQDRTAFVASVQRVMQWDFDRLIVGHGEIVSTGAKERLAAAFAARGF